MPEKIVSDSTQGRTPKPREKEKSVRADGPLHARDEGVAKAKANKKPEKKKKRPKINRYGFLHVNGDLAEHLGLQFGKDKGKDVPVTIERIEGGFVVKLKAYAFLFLWI